MNQRMLIIPAIDLLGGRVVRLVQGDEKRSVVYSDDPSAVASAFEKAGAVWIHVVDLDGAFGRPGVNDAAVRGVLDSVSAKIELGGGIRSMDAVGRILARGAARVILGSAAAQNPELVVQSVERFGGDKIVAGIDVKDGMAVVHGWRGMLAGPRLEAAFGIARETGLGVIVSGGVSGMRDLEEIQEGAVPGVEGVIVGKAYYEKKIDLKEAMDRFQGEARAR
jgi:phosphoribosylformimino-5-aminoimidazole carboxamide ribotide isomerase